MQSKSDKLKSLKIDREEDPKPQSRKLNPAVWITGVAFLGVVLLTVYFFWPEADPGPPSQTQVQVKGDPPGTGANGVGQVSSRPQAILNASGYITARRKATVSAEITGRVTEILIEEGSVVEEGQVVARLDDTLAQVDLDLAKAQVRSSLARKKEIEADLAEAKRVLSRTQELVKSRNASEAALTKAQASVDTLTSALDRANADVDIAKLQVQRQKETVDKHIIRAPFSGVVVDKNAQPGEMISPISAGGGFTRTGICTLVDMESLEIEIDVNENYINRVFAGQKVIANLDSYPDWDIPARVIAVVPTANRDKATVKVRIGLEVRDPRILPEMGVQVAFVEGEDD